MEEKDRCLLENAKIGLLVEIFVKSNRVKGKISRVISEDDSKSGVKVELESGEEGRIAKYIKEESPVLKKITPVVKEKEEKKQKSISEKNSKNEKRNEVIKHIEKDMVIEIDDARIEFNEGKLFGEEDNIPFEVTTRFFRRAYIKPLKNDIFGVVLFKVKGYDVNMAIYKINLYLQKFCLTDDIKYKIIKAEERVK